MYRWNAIIYSIIYLHLLVYTMYNIWTFLVAQMVKHLSTMWETRVWSLGWEDPWRRKWQPTPVLLPGKSHGWSSVVWGCKESDTTERLHFMYNIYKWHIAILCLIAILSLIAVLYIIYIYNCVCVCVCICTHVCVCAPYRYSASTCYRCYQFFSFFFLSQVTC